ncbi:hypothetical protein BURMUCF2_A1799 [Burkholderia multivorans CF2]|nr:hypothetical protein BURMUCF2_A1799 [Burkholderia multivorans CF2]
MTYGAVQRARSATLRAARCGGSSRAARRRNAMKTTGRVRQARYTKPFTSNRVKARAA